MATIKDVLHEEKYLSESELLSVTEIDLNHIAKNNRLKEIVSPYAEKETAEWIRTNGILVPTEKTLLKEWPQYCEEKELEFTLHYKSIDELDQFWFILKNETLSFEKIEIKEFNWAVIPKINCSMPTKEDFNFLTLNKFTKPNILIKQNLFPGDHIAEYTIKFNNTAHTYCDIGCSLEFSKEFIQFAFKNLYHNLYNYLNTAIHKIEKYSLFDERNFIISNDE
jgi:hypothetical protein